MLVDCFVRLAADALVELALYFDDKSVHKTNKLRFSRINEETINCELASSRDNYSNEYR